MPVAARRMLALWFPHLGAERHLRRGGIDGPLATVAERGAARRLAAVSAAAEAAGLRPGMALADARAICPGLHTRPADPPAEAAFLAALARWAGRFSPFVGCDPPDGLVLDITGVAHLFGGESDLARRVAAEAAALGLTLRAGLADTRGAAWALARFGGLRPDAGLSGDSVDAEAPATRARAPRRAQPAPATPAGVHIAPPGGTLAALAPLPVAALRLPAETAQGLARLGLRQITDLVGLPRGALARRFGVETVRRLDQALGAEPEPVAPLRPPPVPALRITLPEPVGHEADILAGLDRLLPPLCARLERAGLGARRLRFELRRSDGGIVAIEVGLARPAREPGRIRPLLALKLGGITAGFGFDMLRLSAPVTEPLTTARHRGGLDAEAEARARLAAGGAEGFADLLGRLGTRIGLDALIRLLPADSHIPERTATRAAAAFSEPPRRWPAPPGPRPVSLIPPEPVRAAGSRPPRTILWRRRRLAVAWAEGPERIAPEWWLDDPAWRSGPRDYWRIETACGTRLWLFEARGAETAGGWFVHGIFA